MQPREARSDVCSGAPCPCCLLCQGANGRLPCTRWRDAYMQWPCRLGRRRCTAGARACAPACTHARHARSCGGGKHAGRHSCQRQHACSTLARHPGTPAEPRQTHQQGFPACATHADPCHPRPAARRTRTWRRRLRPARALRQQRRPLAAPRTNVCRSRGRSRRVGRLRLWGLVVVGVGLVFSPQVNQVGGEGRGGGREHGRRRGGGARAAAGAPLGHERALLVILRACSRGPFQHALACMASHACVRACVAPCHRTCACVCASGGFVRQGMASSSFVCGQPSGVAYRSRQGWGVCVGGGEWGGVAQGVNTPAKAGHGGLRPAQAPNPPRPAQPTLPPSSEPHASSLPYPSPFPPAHPCPAPLPAHPPPPPCQPAQPQPTSSPSSSVKVPMPAPNADGLPPP